MQIKAFTTVSDRKTIHGVVHFPEHTPSPCVICSHGLFSSKDSPKFIAIAESLAAEGFVAIRYDHRGCGESEGKIEDTTVSGRLKDLDSIITFANRQFAIDGTLGLLGSSMGGFISLLAAARDNFFKALVAWATPFFLRRTKKDFKETDYPPLKDGFYEDLNKYNLVDVLGKIKYCLLLHGKNDELVPVWHAEKNYEGLSEPKQIEIFTGGDHRFTDAHHRKKAIRLTTEWFKKYLQGK
jgi:dipeptidyl aminopeptidase/acylaminoacyl peptidase